jgi:anti-anti-sigma factor
LFFATSDALEDRVRGLIQTPTPLTGLVLDCEGIDFIDSQGTATVAEIVDLTNQAGVTLRLARVKPVVRQALERDGVLELIGPDRIHGNIDRAVLAQVEASVGPSDSQEPGG